MSLGRVIVIDDDPQVRRLVATLLDRSGYEAVPMATILQARTELEKPGYDAVLCDVHMSDGSGLELLAGFGRLTGDTDRRALVMMSGDPAAAADIRAVGVGFLEKPFTPETLLAAIGDAVAA